MLATASAALLLGTIVAQAQVAPEWPHNNWKKGKQASQAPVDDDGIGCDIATSAIGAIPFAGGFFAARVGRRCEAERLALLEKHQRRQRQPNSRFASAPPPSGISRERVVTIFREELQAAFAGPVGEQLFEKLVKSGKLDGLLREKLGDMIAELDTRKGTPAPAEVPRAEKEIPKADTKRPPEQLAPADRVLFIQAVLRSPEEIPTRQPLVAPLYVPQQKRDPVPTRDPAAMQAESPAQEYHQAR